MGGLFKEMKRTALILTIIIGLLLAGCSNNKQAFEVPMNGSLDHVHGIGYVGEDDGLYFASHTGLKIYRHGEWFKTSKNSNDYMGFNATNEGFYTSGHPGGDSDLRNPIGIQRSIDGGQTLEMVKFEGETDFHAMAVGYNSHDIFLLNPEKNSELEQGFYKSSDGGQSWKSVSASGLDGEILSLALHPSNSNMAAAATSNGIYLSKDAGEKFQLISDESVVGTAVFFNNENLYYATYSTSPVMINYHIESGIDQTINLPELTEDGVVYIAQNPKNEQQIAIYTIRGQAYITENGTESWVQIIKDGQGK